ncbi:MAG: hypothetical protein U5K00_10745 [Melioribacteraceae bacterium]|nr:hypothetical protein [Melioribacteraceae bacterium]
MNTFVRSFKTLDIIFNTLLLTQLIIGFLFYYLNSANTIEPVLSEVVFLPLIVLGINTTVILFTKYLFTKRNKIDKKLNLEEKVHSYRSLSLLLMTMIEGVNVINLVIFLLSGSTIYLLVAVLILILYFVYRPSKDKFVEVTLTNEEELQLSQQ